MTFKRHGCRLCPMEFKKFEHQVIIRETLLDIYGHVNNAAYFQLLEESRWDFITQQGYGLDKINQLKIGPVLLETKAKFLKELKGREQVTISMQVLEYRGKISRIQQLITKADGQVATEAEFTVALFDLRQRKLVEPTPEWLDAIGAKS